MTTELDQLKEKLARLQLRAMMQHLETVLREAGEKNLGFFASLNRLADFELERRWQNAIKLRWEQAKLHERAPSIRSTLTTTNQERSKNPYPQSLLTRVHQ